jgi:hypothetical protein
MSDLETRLTETLRSGVEAAAPDAIGLADGARRRARERRRHRWETAGVAAVLVGALPLVGYAWSGAGSDAPTRPSVAATVPPSGQPAAPGYRWESWRGVSVQVPLSWDEGSLESWCADSGGLTPRVWRPEDVSPHIRCHPVEDYGLRFSIASSAGLNWPVAEQENDYFPRYAMVGTRDVAGVFIEVATPDASLAQRILDSVVVNDRVAPDGCPATSLDDDGSLQARQSLVSVCGYDAEGLLSHSRQLDDADSTAAAAAVAAAPPLTQCNVPDTDPVVLMLSDKLDAEIDLRAHCLFQRGDSYARTLSYEVATWATLPGITGPAAG